MQDAARRILDYVQGQTFEQYEADDLRQGAVERRFEVIGEASRRISDAFKVMHPEIDWRSWTDFRNVIAHRYEELELEYIWRVATEEVPLLLENLNPLVPPPPES
jgi:uncharacterized protein with HEPN domain